MHTASRAQVSLSPDDSCSTVPVSGLRPGSLPAAGQTGTHISAGKRHWQPPVSLTHGMTVHSPVLQVALTSPALLSLLRLDSMTWGQRPCFHLPPWRPALLCPYGSQSLVGTRSGGRGELSMSLGVSTVCQGFQPACLGCGGLGTRGRPEQSETFGHRPSSVSPCSISHGTLAKPRRPWAPSK